MRVTRIVSGGQTGADRAALDVALALGMPYGGWCPAGGLAEDLPDPPGLLGRYPLLRETPGQDVAVRTRWNVRDSDATLVLVRTDISVSPGSRLTVDVAAEIGRPCTVLAADDAAGIAAWVRLTGPRELNVAGPRESEEPGLYATAYRALIKALGTEPDKATR
jgi:hypothetical protein